MKIGLVQASADLVDFENILKKSLKILKQSSADLIVFPEAWLFGYPPQDFLFQETYLSSQDRIIKLLRKEMRAKTKILVGGFYKEKNKLYNACYLLDKKEKTKVFKKSYLPNNDIFNESRYFTPNQADQDKFFIFKGKKIHVLICEDLFHQKNPLQADIILCLNSSPYEVKKLKLRIKYASQVAKKTQAPLVYVNRVGGQGEIIFDGGSFVVSNQGKLVMQLNQFSEDFKEFDTNKKLLLIKSKKENKLEEIEQALILGLKDFVFQTGFKKVHLGLSGGVDSAVVAYLACQAFGVKNVKAFFLPSLYTHKLSYEIVSSLKKTLNLDLETIDLTSIYKNLLKTKNWKKDIYQQNLLARLRTLYLMGYANEKNSLLLGTSNKSELAVGYSTLYGDLSGALLPIGDLFKTDIYQLAEEINKKSDVFPKKLLKRSPSAELKPNQKDEDDLPPYPELDSILKNLLKNKSPKNKKEKEIQKKIYLAEFKRYQAPPCLRISEGAFGMGWQQPIVHQLILK